MRMPDEGIQLNAESRGRESQLHDKKHTHRKKTRGQVRAKTRLRCRTSCASARAVEHRSHRDDGARACDEPGTTRLGRWRNTPRRWEAQAHEVQWAKHAPRSDSQAQQPDLTSRVGVLEECVYDRRPHDKSTRRSRPRSRQYDHLHDTTTRVGALVAHHPG